jgi:hypothetical protein
MFGQRARPQQSPVFMRVRRTVPQFTFSFSANFVNSNSPVSTGFFWFFPVLFASRFILDEKSRQKRRFLTISLQPPEETLVLPHPSVLRLL